jgi:hypothetical protein
MSIAGLAGFIPALGLFARFGSTLFGRPRWSHVDSLLTMSEKAQGDAKAEILTLVEAHVKALAERDRAMITRQVDWAAVAALIFIAVVSGLLIWGGVLLHKSWSYGLAGAIALVAFVFIGVGFGQIYKQPDGNESA